jgi:hypothetical protein
MNDDILELSEMGGHLLKDLAKISGLAVALSFAVLQGAHAFTETKVAPPAVQPAPLAEVPELQLEKPDDGAGFSIVAPGDSSGETQLTIPGIGSIGSLPKLDFGLELLYGAGADQNIENQRDQGNDDVLIKGKIRHQF